MYLIPNFNIMKKFILFFICFTAIFSTYSCTADEVDTSKPNTQQTTTTTGDVTKDRDHGA
jgi:hypothetical protein